MMTRTLQIEVLVNALFLAIGIILGKMHYKWDKK